MPGVRFVEKPLGNYQKTLIQSKETATSQQIYERCFQARCEPSVESLQLDSSSVQEIINQRKLSFVSRTGDATPPLSQ
jgi:hypothetical protein